MRINRSMQALLCCAVLSSAAVLAQDTSADKVVIKGERISAEELKRSDPVVSMTRDEMMALVSKKKPCARGTQEVGFAAGSLQLDGAAVDVPALVEAITPRAKKKNISCVRVVSPEYDRATFDRLSEALVEPLGVSLMWPK